MRIADAHAHIYPDDIAGRALRQIASFYGFTDRMQEDDSVGTVGKLLELDRAAGISISLVCEAAHKPSLVPTLNRFIAESCASSGGRLLGLAAIHPGGDGIGQILAKCRQQGLRGVKIHPDYQEFNMDDPACDPIYHFCQREGFPILIHCGDDRYDFSSARRLQSVLDRFPHCPVIAAHFGGFRAWESAFQLRPSKNLYFDTSSSLFALSKDQVLAFFNKFGAERFLFGTDYPLFSPVEEVGRFLALDLEEHIQNDILYGNFARLFNLPAQAFLQDEPIDG